MDIRQLTYFIEIIKNKNYTKAAQKLHVTQPILTRTVKQLEDELEVKLIERSSKYFQPTDAGNALYENALALLSRYDDIYRSINDIKSLAFGSVSISVPGLILDMYFPQIFRRFYDQYPNIDINVIEAGSKAAAQAVSAGDVDIGVVMLPIANPTEFNIITLVSSTCNVLTHEDHPFAARKRVHIKELQGERLTTFGNTATLHDVLVSRCRNYGFAPHIAYKSLMPSFDIAMASYGLCVAVLPAPVIQQYNVDGLKETPLYPAIPWKMAVILKKNRYQSFASSQLVGMTRNCFRT